MYIYFPGYLIYIYILYIPGSSKCVKNVPFHLKKTTKKADILHIWKDPYVYLSLPTNSFPLAPISNHEHLGTPTCSVSKLGSPPMTLRAQKSTLLWSVGVLSPSCKNGKFWWWKMIVLPETKRKRICRVKNGMGWKFIGFFVFGDSAPIFRCKLLVFWGV